MKYVTFPADPNLKAEDGTTALHFLAKYKKKRIAVEGANDVSVTIIVEQIITCNTSVSSVD